MKTINASNYDNYCGIECYIEGYLMFYRLASHNTSILDEYMNMRRDILKYRNNPYESIKKETLGIFSLKYLYIHSDFLLESLVK